MTTRKPTTTKRERVAGITFLASFPPIKSAILVGSDGMQIKLEIPETEMGNAVAMLAMRDKVLRVTIEVAQE